MPAKKLSWKLKTLKVLAKIVLGLITIYMFLVWISPTLDIRVEDSLAPNQPFSNPFIIINENFYDVYIVSATFHYKEFKSENLVINASSTTRYILSELKANKEKSIYQINFPYSMWNKALRADMTLSILFKPSFTNITVTEEFDFYVLVSSDGTIRWFQY
ncbi:MAG TPA: hypothetical protein VI362_00035 [Ignavibacteriaceae bacterium]|nr:hypothetical protein [Ignavibacteriaceae bacterium]